MNTTTESPAKPLTFHFQGVGFKIWFRYEGANGQRETVCLIDRLGEDKTFAFGSTVCAKVDQFCKETGRKIALTRALTKGMLHLEPVSDPGHPSTTHKWVPHGPQDKKQARAFRTAAWMAYRSRVRSALAIEKAANS